MSQIFRSIQVQESLAAEAVGGLELMSETHAVDHTPHCAQTPPPSLSLPSLLTRRNLLSARGRVTRGFVGLSPSDHDLGVDSGSEDEECEEHARLRRRREALEALNLNVRCDLDACALRPEDVLPTRLVRQQVHSKVLMDSIYYFDGFI